MIARPLLLGALESALNRYLALDEDAPSLLEPLAGKVIAVRVSPFNWTFFLCPTPDHIQLLESYRETPDTTLSGSAPALGLMGFSATPMRALFSGAVKIEGDITTGRRFQELFDKLEIDVEEQVSHYTGDIIAHQLGRIVRTGQKRARQTLESFRLNLTEYIQEETRSLPAKPEIDIFYRYVDQIRADCDRLQSRVERLLQTEYSPE